jgi:hypothetical protein
MKPASRLERSGIGARRSQRLKLQVPVWVHSQLGKGPRTSEQTMALNVNVRGGMLELKAQVERGDVIHIVHKTTMETQECRVVYVGPSTQDGRKIGFEFTQPGTNFWGIHFPAPGPRLIGR